MKREVRFFGVRGSIATPGVATARVGGNTSCSLLTMAGRRIILDGGTGLRALGAWHGNKPLKADILFSHLHWDHIQGIPFFSPLYNPDSSFVFYGPRGLRQALERQMSLPNFPVSMEVMGASIRFVTISPGDSFASGPLSVTTTALNHPGGAIGYRIEYGDTSVVHALDHEHGNPQADRRLEKLAKWADLLVYDAQYLPEEYESKRGWGHSTYAEGARLAERMDVGKLVLAHHDPTRDDKQVRLIEQGARCVHAASWAAREGMPFEFGRNLASVSDSEMLTEYLAQTLV